MEPSVPACDHTSVGILVFHKKQLLLINRKKPPFGLAAPAGHVDEHGADAPNDEDRFAAAARIELAEETGLIAENLQLIAEGRQNNPCRRPGGDWHYWRLYNIESSGEVSASKTETKGFLWCTREDMERLLRGEQLDIAGEKQALEPIWKTWFENIGVLKLFDSPKNRV